MVALVAGVVMFVLGVLGLIFWWGAFVWVLKGSLPCVLTICGLAALVVAVSSMKDKAAAAKKETPESKPEEKPETASASGGEESKS